MSDTKPTCQRCAKREGHPWDGTGGFTCLCGPCKLRIVFGGARGEQLGVALSAEASLATGQRVDVKFDISDDDDGAN